VALGVGVGRPEAVGAAEVRVSVAVGRGRGVAEDGDVLVGDGGRGVDASGGVAEIGRSRCRMSVTPNAVTPMTEAMSTKSTASSGERRRGGGGATGQGFHPGGGEGGYDTER